MKIVPIYIGTQDVKTAEILANAIANVIQDKRILVVFSTDLCHYKSDTEVKKRDGRLLDLLQESNIDQFVKESEEGKIEACGFGPIVTFLKLQQKMNWAKPTLVKHTTSGDVTGDRSAVVGYAALAVRGQSGLSETDKRALLLFVRNVLRARIAKDTAEPKLTVTAESLNEKRGVFVTLKKHGDLRGCIGRIISHQPVKDILNEIALDSALRDPRFSPVRADELKDLEIEISILTIPTRVQSYKDVRLGIDGIIVESGFKGGVFLPDVATETGWNQEEFFMHCAIEKAGLGRDEISKAKISVFQTEAFKEDPRKN